MPGLRPGYKRSKLNGRPVRIDRKRSMLMKKVARKRKGKHLTSATKMKIKRSRAKTMRSGRTLSGRRIIKPKKSFSLTKRKKF